MPRLVDLVNNLCFVQMLVNLVVCELSSYTKKEICQCRNSMLLCMRELKNQGFMNLLNLQYN